MLDPRLKFDQFQLKIEQSRLVGLPAHFLFLLFGFFPPRSGILFPGHGFVYLGHGVFLLFHGQVHNRQACQSAGDASLS